MSPRLLGTLGMLGSPMLLVEGLVRSLGPRSGTPLLIAAVELLYLGGWLCSAAGLRATGDNPFGGALFAVQVVGLCLAAVFTVWEGLVPSQDARSAGVLFR